MRKTEGGDHGALGRLHRTTAFYHLSERVPGGREAFESPSHPGLRRALLPQQIFKNRKPGGMKAPKDASSPPPHHRKKGRLTACPMVCIQIYFLSQRGIHSRITASAVRTENYLLNQPPHFLPRAGISPSAEPSASPPGPEIYQDLLLW